MKHRIVIPLPYPPDVVMRAMATTRFHLDKIKGLGAFSCELLEEGDDGPKHFVRIRRRMPNRPAVPGAIAKLMPADVVLHHRDEWNSASRAGDIDVQVEGTPVRMRATAMVVPAAGGSEQCFDWEIKASVPLLGGTLEKFVVQDLDRTVVDESRIVRELLKAYV